jgi:hypothetical protein
VTEAGFEHNKFAVYVWRSVREDGDTKTEKSRRTLEIPDRAAEALRQHHTRQAAQRLEAGDRWQGDLVFCTVPWSACGQPWRWSARSNSSCC